MLTLEAMDRGMDYKARDGKGTWMGKEGVSIIDIHKF
jgi:hypothetical protein